MNTSRGQSGWSWVALFAVAQVVDPGVHGANKAGSAAVNVGRYCVIDFRDAGGE
jgi:hypothetical protein